MVRVQPGELSTPGSSYFRAVVTKKIGRSDRVTRSALRPMRSGSEAATLRPGCGGGVSLWLLQLCSRSYPVKPRGPTTGGRTRPTRPGRTSGRTASTTSRRQRRPSPSRARKARTSRSRGRPETRATPLMRRRASVTWRSRRPPPVSSTLAGRATRRRLISRSSARRSAAATTASRARCTTSSGEAAARCLPSRSCRGRPGKEPVARRTTSRARRRTRARRS